jgi:hypothetical protein
MKEKIGELSSTNPHKQKQLKKKRRRRRKKERKKEICIYRMTTAHTQRTCSQHLFCMESLLLIIETIYRNSNYFNNIALFYTRWTNHHPHTNQSPTHRIPWS